MPVVRLRHPGQTLGIGVPPASRQRSPDPILTRQALRFPLQAVGHTSADRLGKGNAEPAGPLPEPAVLAFWKLDLSAHHDGMTLPSSGQFNEPGLAPRAASGDPRKPAR